MDPFFAAIFVLSASGVLALSMLAMRRFVTEVETEPREKAKHAPAVMYEVGYAPIQVLHAIDHALEWRAQGYIEDARDELQWALEIAPYNAFVLMHYANTVWLDGDDELAGELWQQAIALQPEPALYMIRARFFYEEGEDERALRDCERALVIDDDDHDALLLRYAVLVALNDPAAETQAQHLRELGLWFDEYDDLSTEEKRSSKRQF